MVTTIGQLVAGRYRLVEPLAAGGMGGVWLARDEFDRDDPVAVKRCEIPAGLTPDEQDLFRVWTVREARAFALVGHPNVVRTLDVVPGDDVPWIVMEYVPSRSLQTVIDESGPLPPARVAGIGLAVLEALLAVRRAGLLHLDVKPSNVLISHDGRVVLTDFGPAVTSEGVRALAGAGIVLGSPKYLAPERLYDGVALPESDLWSLGATLYHAVEGRPPYARETTAETLLAITEGPPEPPERAGPLAPVIGGLLRHDPAARLAPPEVEELLRDVVRQPIGRPALASPPPSPASPPPSPASPPPSPASPRRRLAAVVAAIAVLIAFVAVFVMAGRDDEPAARTSPVGQSIATLGVAPDGFAWYLESPLFRVALPKAWTGAAALPGGGVRARGARDGWPQVEIRVEPAPGNMVAALTGAESKTRLPGYRRIRIEQPPGSPGAVVWEFSYLAPTAGPVRALQWAVPDDSGKRMFVLDMRTSADAWPNDVSIFDQVVRSFEPVSGG
ncbi:serine/threonine-protein kinase [Actinoplanes sp. NPDC051513]|uniref:serine/threonine-protein kinase n=1 Tax=Actinoplanes sp. NPDC051513 TaxID=3363908 RepID=UPI00378F905F